VQTATSSARVGRVGRVGRDGKVDDSRRPRSVSACSTNGRRQRHPAPGTHDAFCPKSHISYSKIRRLRRHVTPELTGFPYLKVRRQGCQLEGCGRTCTGTCGDGGKFLEVLRCSDRTLSFPHWLSASTRTSIFEPSDQWVRGTRLRGCKSVGFSL
jgi:hypothetical protein